MKNGKTSIYNPGLATAYMMFLPAGIYLCAGISGVTGRGMFAFADPKFYTRYLDKK